MEFHNLQLWYGRNSTSPEQQLADAKIRNFHIYEISHPPTTTGKETTQNLILKSVIHGNSSLIGHITCRVLYRYLYF